MAGDGGKREREINPCVAMVLSDKDMRSGTAVRDGNIQRCYDREINAPILPTTPSVIWLLTGLEKMR